MGKSPFLPRHRLTFFPRSRRVAGWEAFLAQSCQIPANARGVSQRLFLRGKRRCARHARRVRGLGGSQARGGVEPRGQGAAPPRRPSSILSARAGAPAPRSLPRGLVSSAPSAGLRRPPASFPPASTGLQARVRPREGSLHLTSLAGRPSPIRGDGSIPRRGSVSKEFGWVILLPARKLFSMQESGQPHRLEG